MALGYPHPDYLLPLLTSQQLLEWREFSKLEPFGQPEDDVQHSFTRQTIAQTSMAQKSDKSPFTLDEMSLNSIREKEKSDRRKYQTPEEMKQFFLSMPGVKVKQRDNKDSSDGRE